MSQITAIAQDGKILGGIGNAKTSINDRVHAGIWNANNKRQILTEDPARSTSYIYALSGDGQIIAGSLDGYSQLAILRNDGSDWAKAIPLPKLEHKAPRLGGIDGSQVSALNYDGSIAVGKSISNFADTANTTNIRPVVWTGNNWQTLIDLGTLRANNLGTGHATAISEDGKIIGGYSDVDDRANSSATIWTGEKWTTKIRLKSLTSSHQNNQYHNSTSIYALTKDGKIAGGTSTTDDNQKKGHRPVIWSGENYEVITDLGTLDKGLLDIRKPNQKQGIVTSFNDDGTIIAGFSEDDHNERGSWKPVVWKVKYTDASTTPPTNPPVNPPTVTPPSNPPAVNPPTPPITSPVVTPPSNPNPPTTTPPTIPPVVIAKIDVANTLATINKMGQDSFTLMSMQSHALDRLQYSCSNHQGACFGIQQDINASKDKSNNKTQDTAVGLNIGYGFGNGLSAGILLDHSIHRKLPDSYRHHDNNVGIGMVVYYQSPTGYFGEISGAYDKYSATITRPTLANTELGVNDADIKGVAYGMKFGKTFGANQNHRLYTGISHHNITRDAYSENTETAFPVSYGKMQYQQTSAILGANTKMLITHTLSWVSAVAIKHRLSGNDPTYRASLTGVDKYEFSHTSTPAKTQGYVATGLQYQIAPSISATFSPYISKTATGNNSTGALLRLEGVF